MYSIRYKKCRIEKILKTFFEIEGELEKYKTIVDCYAGLTFDICYFFSPQKMKNKCKAKKMCV